MWQQIIPGLRLKLFMTLLVGIAYPLAITGICQAIFPHQANGSLVRAGGRPALVPERFTSRALAERFPVGSGTLIEPHPGVSKMKL